MDPPLISDGQLRACSPEESYEEILPFPKSPKGCLIYLLKKEDFEDKQLNEWVTVFSKLLAEKRECDFELLSSLPSNYSFFNLIYSPDISQNHISEEIKEDNTSKRKYEEKL